MSSLISAIATIESQYNEMTMVIPKKQAEEAVKAMKKQMPMKVNHF